MAESILQQFRLDGQTALITGGNRGLGLEMARALAEAGASIAIASRDNERNRQAANIIVEDYQRPCAAFACDVSDADHVKSTVVRAIGQFGKIDILVNSAGINVRGPIGEISPQEFESVQRVNVTGSWLMCREVIPGMKQQGYGRIINIGSMLSVAAIPERTPYATSKGAVIQLTRALAIELARDRVNVNVIMPGVFATEMNLPLTDDPKKYEEFVARIPMGRWGELHEIGGLALYLASPASSYVTGSCFSVDGGWVAQ